MCLYVMSSLRARLIMPASNTHLESLFVSVRIAREPDACKLLVSSVYRPPSSGTEFWEQYSAQLDGIFVDSSDLLVLGDLNTDILQPTLHHNHHLLKLCAEHQLQNIVHAPTRAPSNTCLDLALLNTTFPLPNPTIIPMSDLTDHHLVCLDIVIPEWKPPATQRTKVVRKPGIATINYSQFNADLNDMLEDSSSFSTLDSQTCHLLTSIAAVTDTHAPPKQVRLPLCPKPKPQPWATPELRKLLQRRTTLHRRVLSQPGNMVLSKQQYRSVRREGTLLSRRLKSRFLMHQFSALRRNPRGQWALLNSLSGRRKVRNQPIASPSSLTETFANIVHDPSRPADICLRRATQQPTTAARLSHFRPVTVAHITTLLRATNTSKSPGSDNVLPAVLKHGRDSIAVSLTDINKSLSTGCVPDIFKNATVSPVFKSGDAESSTNYRPVSLLPICSKSLERVVLEQLIAIFKLHNIMYVPDNQFAYHTNSSCEDCLALVVDEWLKALDNNEYCGIVFADMSKAFDRVKHQELIDELKMLGIADTALAWFASYLTRRVQRVRVGQQLGWARPCTRGVPQGSVLGPLLFCIYTRDAPQCFQHALNQLYADDITLYIRHKSIQITTTQLSADLAALDRYLDQKGLVLNPSKTQFVLLRRPGTELPPGTAVNCRGTSIVPSAYARYLGILVDEHLSF